MKIKNLISFATEQANTSVDDYWSMQPPEVQARYRLYIKLTIRNIAQGILGVYPYAFTHREALSAASSANTLSGAIIKLRREVLPAMQQCIDYNIPPLKWRLQQESAPSSLPARSLCISKGNALEALENQGWDPVQARSVSVALTVPGLEPRFSATEISASSLHEVNVPACYYNI